MGGSSNPVFASLRRLAPAACLGGCTIDSGTVPGSIIDLTILPQTARNGKRVSGDRFANVLEATDNFVVEKQLAALPVRHVNGQGGAEGLVVVGMEEVKQLVKDDIVNAVLRGL